MVSAARDVTRSGAERARAREAVRARMANVARAVRFRPCVDIHDGKVKQIVGSTLRDGVTPGDASSETPAALPCVVRSHFLLLL